MKIYQPKTKLGRHCMLAVSLFTAGAISAVKAYHGEWIYLAMYSAIGLFAVFVAWDLKRSGY